MNMSEYVSRRSSVKGILRTLLILAIPATAVLGLPKGYREDFNGCSSQQDPDKRATCCDEVARDCHAVCGKSYDDGELGPGAWIMCGLDCDDARDSCGNGSTIKERIDWPGQPGLQIPGVFIEDNRIVTEEGIGLGVSTRSTVIEIRGDEAEREPSACTAVVATCKCPLKGLEYEAVGKECRPVVTSGVVECRICSTGESSEACMSCDACAPVILSVRPCAGAEPGRQKALGR
ncbi:MAG: hypothetical protein WBH85_10425 [Thermoanaerobaculia bacterium]